MCSTSIRGRQLKRKLRRYGDCNTSMVRREITQSKRSCLTSLSWWRISPNWNAVKKSLSPNSFLPRRRSVLWLGSTERERGRAAASHSAWSLVQVHCVNGYAVARLVRFDCRYDVCSTKQRVGRKSLQFFGINLSEEKKQNEHWQTVERSSLLGTIETPT